VFPKKREERGEGVGEREWEGEGERFLVSFVFAPFIEEFISFLFDV